MNSNLLQSKIANTLKNIGTEICLSEAKRIEALPTLKNRFHFRKLNLTTVHIKELMDILLEENNYPIRSISFSDNLIGDKGAEIISNQLPNHIEEIGLVRCGIGDVGAEYILSAIQHLPNLDMICLEENQLSDSLKLEFQKFGAFNPDLMVIV